MSHWPLIWLRKTMGWVVAAFTAAMVTVTFVQVIRRYVLGDTYPWAEEFARYCFVWIVFLGSVLAYERGVHIGVDLLTQHAKGGLKKALAVLVELLIVIFCVAVIYASIPILEVNQLQVSPGLGVRMSHVYTVIPLSMALIVVLATVRIVRILRDDEAALQGQQGLEL